MPPSKKKQLQEINASVKKNDGTLLEEITAAVSNKKIRWTGH
jgi:hypothetical protein